MKISADHVVFDVEGDDWRTLVTVDAFGVVAKIAPRFGAAADDGYAREQMIDEGLIRPTREGDVVNEQLADAATAAIRTANVGLREPVL
jgi:hypothetical protein